MPPVADITSSAAWPSGRVLVVAATYEERANMVLSSRRVPGGRVGGWALLRLAVTARLSL